MNYYHAICQKNSRIVTVKIKANDSNQAYFNLEAKGYSVLTGLYREPREAIWSFNSAIPLPTLNWKEVF